MKSKNNRSPGKDDRFFHTEEFFIDGNDINNLYANAPSSRSVIDNAIDDAGGSTLYWNGGCKVTITVEFIHKELRPPGLHKGRCKRIV
jgi:hypothetical protein